MYGNFTSGSLVYGYGFNLNIIPPEEGPEEGGEFVNLKFYITYPAEYTLILPFAPNWDGYIITAQRLQSIDTMADGSIVTYDLGSTKKTWELTISQLEYGNIFITNALNFVQNYCVFAQHAFTFTDIDGIEHIVNLINGEQIREQYDSQGFATMTFILREV
jgi:hypothetical protein